MTLTSNAAAVAAASAAISLLLAGCGGSSPSPSSASTNGTFVASAYQYADCMRTHGVTNFPDPKVEAHDGSQSVAMVVPSTLAGSPAFHAAARACQPLLPKPIIQTPAQQHARAADLVSFARCIRAHGINNFPDPTPQGQLTRAMLAAAHVDIGLPEVQKAAFACVPAAHGAITSTDVRSAINRGG